MYFFLFLSNFPHFLYSQSAASQKIPIRQRLLSAHSIEMQKVSLSGKIKDTEPGKDRARAWRPYHSALCVLHYYTASQKPLLRLELLQLLLSPLKILMVQESRRPTRVFLKYLTLVEAHPVGSIIKLHCSLTKQDRRAAESYL